jgi:hypothetical protein
MSAVINGDSQQNGKHVLESLEQPKNMKRPRAEESDSVSEAKKPKLAADTTDEVVVVVEDDGAILIPDD